MAIYRDPDIHPGPVASREVSSSRSLLRDNCILGIEINFRMVCKNLVDVLFGVERNYRYCTPSATSIKSITESRSHDKSTLKFSDYSQRFFSAANLFLSASKSSSSTSGVGDDPFGAVVRDDTELSPLKPWGSFEGLAALSPRVSFSWDWAAGTAPFSTSVTGSCMDVITDYIAPRPSRMIDRLTATPPSGPSFWLTSRGGGDH